MEFENIYGLNLPIQEDSLDFDPYGTRKLISEYCGFNNKPPYVSKNYNWSHGWIPDYWLTNTFMALGGVYNPDNWCFCAKKKEEHYLKIVNNYPTAIAIGLNVVYLPETEVERIPNSLLVMPVHSVDFTTNHKNWRFKEYVDQISEIKHLFDKIVVCVHPNCFSHGHWVDDFKNAGFDVIIGIDGSKTNALHRLQYLMKSFEFITTNGFGSMLAYASYFGAKPSIYGTFSEYKFDDVKHDPVFNGNEALMHLSIEATSEKKLRDNFPQLFCFPNESKIDSKWGEYQVGYDCKISPLQLKKMLGWDTKGQIRFLFSKPGLKFLLAKFVPKKIKQIIKSMV